MGNRDRERERERDAERGERKKRRETESCLLTEIAERKRAGVGGACLLKEPLHLHTDYANSHRTLVTAWVHPAG